MKSSFYKLIVFLLVFATACTDLDLQPGGSAVPGVFFEDEASYRQFIARVYSGLAVTGQQGPAGAADISSLDEGFSNYLRQYWQLQELTTEEAVIAWGDVGLPQLHNHTWTSSNQFVNAMYYRIFFQISMANEFLRESTTDKLNERGVSAAIQDDVRHFRAEARFLRALSYWHGIDLFGNVPFYTEDTAIGSDPPRQGSRQEVFDFIISELNAIEADMMEPGMNEYGRADKGALWMLQAKVLLNAEVYTGTGRYADALAAVNNIIASGQYALEDNYANLFLADNNNSGELIFSIPFDGERTQTWGGMTYLVHAPIGGSMDAVAESVFGVNGGWFGLRTTSTLPNLFPDPNAFPDARALFWTDGQTIDIPEGGISNFNNGYGIQKYKNVTSQGELGSDLTHPDNDFPMFRLADAYLMYVECFVRGGGGDAGTAVGYINMLRERAYGNANGNIEEADLDLDFILAERGRELYWEGHRRTDRIRFGQFSDNGIWPWKGGVPEGQITESYRDLLPIPAAELLANPNLQQNEGY
ncbi:MAG: RagB/SusD family nutrient uptake outer membrane protein [Bacteroidota bacterium]